MAETKPATFKDEPQTGYVYLAHLSKNGQTHIGNLLHQLTADLPGIIWPMPVVALHTTLCEIIQARKDYSQDKDSLFKQRQREYIDGPTSLLKHTPSFKVLFNHIEISPEAIIVRTEEGSAFNGIRAALLERITLPDGTRQPPDIIHTSIAHFTEVADLEEVRDIVARRSIAFEEEITSFSLLRTSAALLQEYDTLRTYPLQVNPLEATGRSTQSSH